MEQNFNDIIRIVETMSKYATSEIFEEITSILEEECEKIRKRTWCKNLQSVM